MGYRPHYSSGDWSAICDICGRLYEASMLQKRWDGFMCCPDDWEIRQPQDFVRGVVDKQTTPWVRDEAADQFVLFCTTRTSIAGFAIAGCMIAGSTLPVSRDGGG